MHFWQLRGVKFQVKCLLFVGVIALSITIGIFPAKKDFFREFWGVANHPVHPLNPPLQLYFWLDYNCMLKKFECYLFSLLSLRVLLMAMLKQEVEATRLHPNVYISKAKIAEENTAVKHEFWRKVCLAGTHLL